MATPTLRSQVAALTDAVAALTSLVAAQATAAPVETEANAPAYVSDKLPCQLHVGCTRKLSQPAAAHEPCSGKGDPMHDKLRASHRHF